MSVERGESRFLTIPQAAAYANTSKWFIRSLLWAGQVSFIPAGKRHLIDKADLDKFLDSRKQVVGQLNAYATSGSSPGRRGRKPAPTRKTRRSKPQSTLGIDRQAVLP
jgi:excisionase family DNA binding protein